MVDSTIVRKSASLRPHRKGVAWPLALGREEDDNEDRHSSDLECLIAFDDFSVTEPFIDVTPTPLPVVDADVGEHLLELLLEIGQRTFSRDAIC